MSWDGVWVWVFVYPGPPLERKFDLTYRSVRDDTQSKIALYGPKGPILLRRKKDLQKGGVNFNFCFCGDFE